MEKTLENILNFIDHYDEGRTSDHNWEWLEAQIANQLRNLYMEAYAQGRADEQKERANIEG